ncbi:MAG TPA: Pvc16 family protein [Myxococcales bacterium]
MPKHQVIRDVGHSLLGVLRAELSAARAKGKAYLAAPNAEFLRKNQPCLMLFLYDLRPSIRVAHEEKWELEEEIVDERGEAHIVKYGRPLELRLRYLLTAAADDLGDEHELLGLGMKGFLDHPKLTGEQLAGDSFSKGDALTVHHDSDFTLAISQAVLGGLGTGPRLAVGYQVDTRLYSGREVGRTRRVRERHIDVFDPLRPPPGSISAKELGVEAKPPRIVGPPGKK